MRVNCWAVIEGENVVNTILWDGVTQFNPGDQYILVDISDDKYDYVSSGWKYVNGEFIAPPEPEAPEVTHEQYVAMAEAMKRQKVTEANAVFLSWQTKLLLNRATDDEKVILNQWVDYVDDIQSVDTQQAPNITWPEQPPIPENAQ